MSMRAGTATASAGSARGSHSIWTTMGSDGARTCAACTTWPGSAACLVTERGLGLVHLLARHAGSHHGRHVMRWRFGRTQVIRQRQLGEQQRQDHEHDRLAAEKAASREHAQVQ